MPSSYLDELLSDPESRKLFEEERLILQATDCIVRALKREGINKTELAERLDKSNAFITQVLNGTRNMTFRTFADFLYALGYTADICEVPLAATNRVAFTEERINLDISSIAKEQFRPVLSATNISPSTYRDPSYVGAKFIA